VGVAHHEVVFEAEISAKRVLTIVLRVVAGAPGL